jgi:UDP-GlcNAc3NAcA epimerase
VTTPEQYIGLSPEGRSLPRRLLYVIGTRPEVIRSAEILRLLRQDDTIEVLLLNTMQHYDNAMMSDLLGELDIPIAAFTLSRLEPRPAIRSGQMIERIAVILSRERFDAVVVYGDTDSSLAAALAAAKSSIPVIHVEAGCRSGDLRMQEELNRRLIDHMSALLLAVSANCAEHLFREEVTGSVKITGDPQFDVFVKVAPTPFDFGERIHRGFITIHRSENVDDPEFLPAFLNVLTRLTTETGLRFIWPVHPRARAQMLEATEGDARLDCLDLVEPMPYGVAMKELARSKFCITDSGGLQKEAFWLQVPCVTIRPSTEWIETVELGANRLAPTTNALFETAMNCLDSPKGVRWSPDPYGGVGSADRVAMVISSWLAGGLKSLEVDASTNREMGKDQQL